MPKPINKQSSEKDTINSDNVQSLLKNSHENCEVNGNNFENLKTEDSLLTFKHIDVNEPPTLSDDDLITLNLPNDITTKFLINRNEQFLTLYVDSWRSAQL
ncbi:16786_t:CDS:2 [Gigaspora margarita]|uniref:16786_t:CDS:1 n=1 Tax=Gigaspora margarita TaxID=4874 RepID=A0ABN7V7G2_GIGMA|nr:16786_t:CDS:2 [Gigaspora margarita]